MKKVLSLFFIIFINTSFLFSQAIYNKDGIRLYHYLSAEEAELYKSVDMQLVTTAAPSGELRPIAEYEPAEAVLVRYPFGIPFSLIKEMAKDVKVITIVANTSEKNTVLNQYNSNGVNTANCDFLIAASDSYWTRDYGPWFMAINNHDVGIYDFTYNRPRPNDNQINTKLATYLSLNRYASTIKHTGGNFMNDGINQAASTKLVLEENPSYTQQDIEAHFLQYMGIEHYHITDDPLSEYIEHIDCWGKYLAPDKVMIGQVPQSDSRYNLFEDIANYFASQTSSWGTPYKVYRVYTPGAVGTYGLPTPYTNSLILNNKVFVAISGNSNDAAAIAAYKAAMPGYEVIPINYSSWEDTDALHCRTHEIADRCMLYIKHQPLFGEIENTGSLTINAEVYSYCDNTIYPDSVLVYLKIEDGEYQPYNMQNSDNHTWSVTIQNLPSKEIDYYIYAADMSNRREKHPLIGAADPHIFKLIGEPSSVDEINNNEINIYPNPAYDFINIYNTISSTANIYNIFGQKIREIQIKNGVNTIDIKDLPSNIYFITINNKAYKFIKK